MRPSLVGKMNDPNVTTAAATHSITDEDLVTAAKAGDELAFETLIKRYESRIFAVALRYIRVHEDAEDVVQQTFQKAFIHLQKFQGRSTFGTWLTRIAINESLMVLRKGRSSREVSFEDACSEDAISRGLEILDSSLNPEMRYLQQEAVDILFSAMTQLSPGTRDAVELTGLRELSGPATARHLGLSIGAVKARVFQGRRKLRRLLRGSVRTPRISSGTFLAVAGNATASRKVA